MNKKIAKFASLSLGLALAVGVGVALSSKKVVGTRAADTLSYTLDFKANTTDTDGTSALGNTVADYFTDGASNVTSLTSSKVYLGKSSMKGIKFGSSSAKGTLTLTLASSGQVKATKLTLALAMYDSGEKVNVSINGGSSTQLAPTQSLADYDVAWDGETNLSTIKVEARVASKCRFYLDYIKVFVDDGSAACEHNWVAGTVHAPTCTEDGYTEYECSECHEEKHDDIVPATGHDYGEWTEVTPASCLTAGEEKRVCSHDSSHVETRPIAALGHHYVDGICDRCGAEEPDEVNVDYVFSEHYSANTMLDDTPIAIDENISAVFTAGGTPTQYYTNGEAARWYGGGTLTISSSLGNISSIEINYSRHDKACSANVGSYTDITSASGSATWVGDDAAVVFTLASGSGHNRIVSLSITYDKSGAETFTITYLANAEEAEGEMEPTTATAPQVATCGFTREGYEFARWNTQADGEGDNYEVGTSVSEDLTLYAIWQEYIAPIEGNVSMEGVTSATAVTVNGHPALKCGAGSTAGAMKLVLNKAGVEKIKVYVAGWKGDANKTVNLEVVGDATLSTSSIELTEDVSLTGTISSVTLSNPETTFVFTLELTGASQGDEITLTAAQAKNNRFVVWGATDLFAETFANEFMNHMHCDASGKGIIAPTYDEGYDWTQFQSIYNGLDAQEKGRLGDADAKEDGTIIEQAMARYDYVAGKYKLLNFINGRTPVAFETIPSLEISSVTNNSAILVIAAIALVCIASVTLVIVIKRR